MITAQISQLINKLPITAGAAGKRHGYSGFTFLTTNAVIKKSKTIITALISKNVLYELSVGIKNEMSQLPIPITGGYSIEFVCDV